MQLELALKCTGTSNCKWHGAIGAAQDMLLSGEEKLRQSLRSLASAQHDVSQLGDLKARPGSSPGGLEHVPPVRMHLTHQALPGREAASLQRTSRQVGQLPKGKAAHNTAAHTDQLKLCCHHGGHQRRGGKAHHKVSMLT